MVASFTDAWIETANNEWIFEDKKSHLLQMRGLKPYASIPITKSRMSHLLQMRGLKLINPEARKKALESHLLQMRGLKP